MPGQRARRRVVAVLFAAVVGHEFFGDAVDDAVGLAQAVDPDADFLQTEGFGAVVGGPVDAFVGCGCVDVSLGWVWWERGRMWGVTGLVGFLRFCVFLFVY